MSATRPGGVLRVGLAEQVYRQLEQGILDHEIPPGAKLIIDQIARDLGVSSTPVRDALNRLSTNRLVTFAPYVGFRVRELLSREEVAESFDARLPIESAACEMATAHLDKRTLEEIRSIAKHIEESAYDGTAESYLEFTRANRQFHRLIVSTSNNRYLLEAWDNLSHDELIALTLHERGIPDKPAIIAEHRAIIDALEVGNPARVREACAVHVVDGKARIMKAISKNGAEALA